MKRSGVALCAGLLCMTSVSSQAGGTDSVTYTVEMPAIEEFYFFSAGDFGDGNAIPITGIPKFDPSLGTLVDVLVEYDYEVEVDAYIEAQGILNPGVPHFASFSVGQLVLGLTFLNNVDDPPVFTLIGDVYTDFGVGCMGNPGDGDACSEFNNGFYAGGILPTSLAGLIVLDDFVGTDDYEGLFFEFDAIGLIWDLDNVDSAFGEVGGFNSNITFLTIEYVYEVNAPDSDGDGVSDDADNCIEVPNPGQEDADGDGYGNACDADVNNDCIVNAIDLGALKAAFFGTDPLLDFNSDGVVNAIDLGVLRTAFFGTPGPSGLTSACTPSLRQQETARAPVQVQTFDEHSKRYIAR